MANGAATEAVMKQDRLNFNKLGKFEREEFKYLDNFKKQFNGALDMLTRNDFGQLRETVKKTEDQMKKAKNGSLTSTSKMMNRDIPLPKPNLRMGNVYQRRYINIEVPENLPRS